MIITLGNLLCFHYDNKGSGKDKFDALLKLTNNNSLSAIERRKVRRACKEYISYLETRLSTGNTKNVRLQIGHLNSVCHYMKNYKPFDIFSIGGE